MSKKKFDIGRLTVDLMKEMVERVKKEKNFDALFEFYLLLPFDLVRAFYMRYIKKENCYNFYTLDGYCCCEKSSHFFSFPK